MFFKGTVTICWREIIPVVKLAHSEPGGVVRVDAFVCISVCKCAWLITSTWGMYASLSACGCLFLYVYPNVFAFSRFFMQRDTHPSHALSLFQPKDSHQFLCVCVCARVCACVYHCQKPLINDG